MSRDNRHIACRLLLVIFINAQLILFFHHHGANGHIHNSRSEDCLLCEGVNACDLPLTEFSLNAFYFLQQEIAFVWVDKIFGNFQGFIQSRGPPM